MNRRYADDRGQTIILVAVSLISLLAMAALAIDIVSLYTARSEIQRAADAAALAGAKAIADSGITSLSGDDLVTNQTSIQLLAQNMANAAVAAVVASTNLVAGAPVSSPTTTFNFDGATAGPRNSWQITVKLTQPNVPTFFARIWGRQATSVSATSVAEAYNPGNTPSGNYTPIAPRCVKPWLVANQDPDQSGSFINKTTGAVEDGIIDETFDLTPDCPTCTHTDNPPQVIGPAGNHGNKTVEFIAATVSTNPQNICPSSSSSCSGTTPHEESVQCCDENSYQGYLNCGAGIAGTNQVQWDSSVDLSGGTAGQSAIGAVCLIHAEDAGYNKGQDTLDPSLWPSGPRLIHSAGGSSLISSSTSIATIPVIDSSAGPITSGVTVVGFLQGFINCVEDGTQRNCDQGGSSNAGDISVTVWNVVGCGTNYNTSVYPIVGGNGASPIPVRLITPP